MTMMMVMKTMMVRVNKDLPTKSRGSQSSLRMEAQCGLVAIGSTTSPCSSACKKCFKQIPHFFDILILPPAQIFLPTRKRCNEVRLAVFAASCESYLFCTICQYLQNSIMFKIYFKFCHYQFPSSYLKKIACSQVELETNHELSLYYALLHTLIKTLAVSFNVCLVKISRP